MKKNLTEDQKRHILDIQRDAKELLADPKRFNEKFETLFSKYDKNRDGTIEFNEYQEFMKEMLIGMGRTKIQPTLIYSYFERADSDKSGQIEKEEFRKEVKKRLREFYIMNL